MLKAQAIDNEISFIIDIPEELLSYKILKITLFVEDDGVGISEEKLVHLLKSVDTKDLHGYGVRNINDRLQLKYGSEYGLFYKSTVGIGTVVEVRIPAEK